jgi:hypothetical protein
LSDVLPKRSDGCAEQINRAGDVDAVADVVLLKATNLQILEVGLLDVLWVFKN